MYAINLFGVIGIRAAAKVMGEGGRIITIGSGIATRAGFPGVSDLAATKAGVVGFTKGAARDLARRNITINVVQCGVIETDLSAEPALRQIDDGIPQALARPRVAAGRIPRQCRSVYVTGTSANVTAVTEHERRLRGRTDLI